MDPSEIEKQNKSIYERAGASIEEAKKIILENIPKEEIVSIYLKGSFVQEEMNEGSDVDVVVILKTDTYLSAVYELTSKYGKTTNPPFQAVAYVVPELQTGKDSPKRERKTTSVSRFGKHISSLPLIYGNAPDFEIFKRTDEKDFSINLNVFRDKFIPEYEKGLFGFDELVKQVFWLVEAEQRLKGKDVGYSWQKLIDTVEDKDHIIHQALELRRKNEVSDEEKMSFLEKLKDYISSFDK